MSDELLLRILHEVQSTNRIINQMSERLSLMVTRDQFDTALQGAVTTISTSISDLQAKVLAGTVQTPEDFTAELTELQGVVQTAVSADPAASTTPATPSTPAAPASPTPASGTSPSSSPASTTSTAS